MVDVRLTDSDKVRYGLELMLEAAIDIPCTTANLAYVKAHPAHDWAPLYAAPVPRQAAPADEALLRQAVEALQWSKTVISICDDSFTGVRSIDAAIAAITNRLKEHAK